MRADVNAGPKELNEDFIRSLPDNGPVVMVNLLRFKGELADGDGSGWDAYSRYSKAIPPLLKGVGGTILWAGDVEGAAYGDLNAKHWEFVVLVRDPSRKAFLKMATSPEYAQANVHREYGVDDHVILASTETYSSFLHRKPSGENLTLSPCDTHKTRQMKSLSASGLASGTSGGAVSTVSACAAIGGEGRRRSECQEGDCDGASIEELKALVMTHLERLVPVLGLQALRAPADAITNGDMWRGWSRQ